MILIYILVVFSIVGTLLPYIDNAHWVIRGQSYFRAVYLGLNLLLIGVVLFFMPMGIAAVITIILLIIAALLCWISVYPFTRWNKVEVPVTKQDGGLNPLNIVVFNVYQYNTDYARAKKMIQDENPDVVFLIETSTDWKVGLKELEDRYPFYFDDIRENTYGLMLFSKKEILEGGVNYLVKPDIPSAELLLEVGGQKVRILGLHPKPPVPGEDVSTYFKDRELAQAARYLNAQKEDDHQILIGDLNDVAWSRASIAFKKATGMKDPRIGRGFYSTFPTWFPIKIPLDHVFCSPELELIDFKLLPDIGSDHYPVQVKFHVNAKN